MFTLRNVRFSGYIIFFDLRLYYKCSDTLRLKIRDITITQFLNEGISLFLLRVWFCDVRVKISKCIFVDKTSRYS